MMVQFPAFEIFVNLAVKKKKKKGGKKQRRKEKEKERDRNTLAIALPLEAHIVAKFIFQLMKRG